MRKKYMFIVSLLMLIVVILTSCQKSREASTDPSNMITQEDTVIISLDIEPDEGFDPILGWGRYGTLFFQSTLIKRDKDRNPVADLATEWQLTEDRLTWKIKIREDARFSDGTPVTAKDVAFTFNQAAEAGGKTDVSVLEKATVTGPFTVELRLTRPHITFANRLSTLGIVPSHIYNKAYGRNPVGSGPYKFVRWDEGRQVVMERNPDYYGKKPEIKKVIFLFMEEDAAFVSAKAGNVHVIRVPQMLAKQTIAGMHLCPVKSVDNRGICFPFLPEQDPARFSGRSVGNNVTSDLSIRKAVNYAVDREQLVNGILEGYGSPAHGPVSMLPWNESSSVIADGDTKKAAHILKEGGWQDTDGDGILEKGGVKASFTLLYPADDSIRQALALSVSDTVRKIGIDIVVTGKSWDDIYKMMYADAVLFGFGSFDQTEMHNLYCGLRTECMIHNAGYYNAGYYRNETVDSYLKKAMACTSEKEAFLYWKRAQWDGKTGFTAKGDAAWAWLVNLDHTYFVSDRLDTGTPSTEQHGSAIVANLPEWRWIVQ